MFINDKQLLIRWLSIDSTSGKEADFLTQLEEDFASFGFSITRQPVAKGRWNIVAQLDPSCPPEIFLSTHIDTVPPFFGPTIFDEYVHARGACDTKGGLFTMLQAWKKLAKQDQKRVGFLLVVGEEVDHIGAIKAAEYSFPALRAILLCEPTRNRVAKGQKGILKLRLIAQGKAGHSAFASAGESAIHKLLEVLHDLQTTKWPKSPILGETSFNIGTIHGGVAANVFAPSAEAVLLFRTVSPSKFVEKIVQKIADSRVQIEVISQNDPVTLNSWDCFEQDIIPFNTDASYLESLAPIILAGPGDIRLAHGPEEKIHFNDIKLGILLYSRLINGLLQRSLTFD